MPYHPCRDRLRDRSDRDCAARLQADAGRAMPLLRMVARRRNRIVLGASIEAAKAPL